MPITTNYTSRTATISCTRCPRQITVDAPITRESVAGIFGWHTGRQAPQSMCLDCYRRRAAERRAAGAPRRASATRSRRPLGLDRKFGVELEMYLPPTTDRYRIQAAFEAAGLTVGRGNGAWTIKGDGSLVAAPGRGFQGCEITSPALHGEDGLRQVETACRILRDHGAQVNRTCGTHVHHDAADLTIADVKTVARSWKRNHRIIDGFVSASRRAENAPTYCRPLSDNDLATVERCRDLGALRHAYLDRYRTLNLAAYSKFGTLEIRQHQGTISYEKIRTWILLGQAVIDTAKAAPAEAEQTRTSVRDFLAGLGERLDETARTFLIGRAVEFGYAAL